MKLKSLIVGRSKKFWVWTVIILLLLAGVAYGAYVFSSPATGTVNNSVKTKDVAKPAESFVRVEGKTISFSYPSKFHSVTAEKLSANEVEKYVYLNPRTISQNMNVIVRRLPSGNLADDSGFNLRTSNPTTYPKQTKVLGGKTWVIFSESAANANKVAYLEANGLDLNVAFVSADITQKDDMTKSFEHVLASMQWQ